MDAHELIEKIASTQGGLRWTMHNCWPAQVSTRNDGVVVDWRDDLGPNTIHIKQGSIQGIAVHQSNSHREVFRFRHATEGEVVLTHIHRDPQNKGSQAAI